MTPSILGDSKNPVEAVGEFHGPRPDERRTHGSTERTYALSLINAYRLDMLAFRVGAEHLADFQARGVTRPDGMPLQVGDPDPDFQMPELEELHAHLANAWASHAGWDTETAIKMVEAGTSVRLNPLVNGNAPDAKR